jgi:hypothetical protein
VRQLNATQLLVLCILANAAVFSEPSLRSLHNEEDGRVQARRVCVGAGWVVLGQYIPWLVSGRDGVVLRQPVLGATPAALREAAVYGGIKSAPVGAGLTAGDNLDDYGHLL